MRNHEGENLATMLNYVHIHIFMPIPSFSPPSRPFHKPAMPETKPLPCTGARVRKLMRRMTAFYEHHLRGTGLKLSQYSLLAHLDEKNPQSLLDLAARLEMDRTTLTRSLNPLIAAGWAGECACTDGRRRLFILTPEGGKALRAARTQWAKAQLALEDHLGREYVARLNTELEHALEQLKPALPEEN